ncbi:MAG: spheroidene monooxygenase [Chitinophagaceae bacterium]
MICTLSLVRYPKYFAFAGFLSMAVFRFFLFMNKKIAFWKLMGCGKNGTFDKTPDWQQWSILLVPSNATQEKLKTEVNYDQTTQQLMPAFIHFWHRLFRAEVLTMVLQSIEGHGTWDNQEPFGKLAKQTDYDGIICVLTRATIRLNKLQQFWKNVDAVAHQMAGADGFITSVGIGEVPFIKQATFSVWKSKTQMKQFAYKMQEHATVIKKTRKENWYSEEMFVRFIPLFATGTLNGIQPLAGKL